MYINGDWIQTEEQFNVINPATNEVIGFVPNGGTKEAAYAVDAAYTAFKTWSQRTAVERSQVLKKWHQLIEMHKEELAAIMTEEQGKPTNEALGEAIYANSFVEWYSEEAKRIYGETIPASVSNKRLFVIKQPVGVVAVITPWNFPAAMITRKVAPALAAGCTVIIKPAEQTPLTAIKLAELAHEAGIPKGVFNIVTGQPQTIGETWLKDSRVRKISFTGSTEIGKLLMKGASETVKKVSLELGGQAPFIVFEDADLDDAVTSVIASKYRNTGQTCVCANRIYVQETIYDKFIEKFKTAVNELKIGNGMDEGVNIGPLIDSDAIEKVNQHLKNATDLGAQIIYGEQQIEHLKGNFIKPTIVSHATDQMLCMIEETFGPLAPVSSFKTEEEVIHRANNTQYGLAAYVFTENINLALRVSEQLEYGVIGLNDGMPAVPQAPFGGVKESGLGREGGHYGIEEFLEVKYISLGIK
ncbi:NAD-dependent succinate-semialdehyde dehydrogenase [Chengkuizengella axinellae]|uniref:Aldehyde dehydrogenase n=1 Tax=Chengkuizengella axinellae TaxID=3064388 RepID=A0ABT9J690_9BACL|nr:NAD-dependent succinate-semialdehyde dehydrogenase [Chengkuizengella sp. 2205SS18-9]MDP5277068.1 NAD-dependent succinate-semialdehyde dehydrogenase [Chengkuizengella sp. 2205SS18-9]